MFKTANAQSSIQMVRRTRVISHNEKNYLSRAAQLTGWNKDTPRHDNKMDEE